MPSTPTRCSVTGTRYRAKAGLKALRSLGMTGLGIVLCFVGLKMTVLPWLMNGHVPIGPSLVFILAVLVISIAGSLLYPKRPHQEIS